MTRVLVTGASTPVGMAVVHNLAADARVARVIAVQRPGEPPIEPRGADGKVMAVAADLTHTREIRSLMFGVARREACDVLLHLAAHRAARDEGGAIHALNVEATR